MLVVKQGRWRSSRLRRPADRRHLGGGVQVRLDRAARPPRHLAGAAADRQVRDQPALLRGRERAHGHPEPQLVRGRRARPTSSTSGLEPIVAKSREGFVFRIDLQVQIHVPDTTAPRVISMVGTMPTWSTRCCKRPWATTSATSCRACRPSSSSRPARQVQQEAFDAHPRATDAVRSGDPRRVHPGRDPARASWSRC